jgi:hypothetical protein
MRSPFARHLLIALAAGLLSVGGISIPAASPSLAAGPSEDGSRALGTSADAITWLMTHGFTVGEPQTTDAGRRWTARTDRATAELIGSSGVVASFALAADISSVSTDTDPLAVLIRAWVADYAPGGLDFLSHVFRFPAASGKASNRQHKLAGRMFRVEHQIDDGTGDRQEHVRLTVTPLPTSYVVRPVTTLEPPCRDLDPTTGHVSDELRVDFAVDIRNVDDRSGDHVWIVTADPGHIYGTPTLEGVSWGQATGVIDRDDGTVMLPGPRVGVGDTVHLAWRVSYHDTTGHYLESRMVLAPKPESPPTSAQLRAVRTATAIATWGGDWLSNEPCPGLPGAPDLELVLVRDHLLEALDSLEVINDEIEDQMNQPQMASIDEQLGPIEEIRDWAAAELVWADAHVSGAFRAAHPVAADWVATVSTFGVLARHVVATRGYNSDEVGSVLMLLGQLLITMPGRIGSELATP